MCVTCVCKKNSYSNKPVRQSVSEDTLKHDCIIIQSVSGEILMRFQC